LRHVYSKREVDRDCLVTVVSDWPDKYSGSSGQFESNARAANVGRKEEHAGFYADVDAEMKYIVAALYSNYSTTVVDDTDIEQSDSYTAPPKSDKLIIRLEKLET
jgi:hypothetical protein